ncbi:MAG: hypothetical protein J6S19_00385, partial [Lentisphaeria bacterium]|nr:hypothetical protein [Lentisphaeria bacterium]
MKKLLLCMLLFSAASALFAEALRIDIAGLPENVIPKEMTGNSTCEALLRNGKINRKMIFPVGNDWQEFTFAIESPTACDIRLALRTTNSNWVVIDDIFADKIVIPNGDFEEFRNANRLKFWNGSKITLERKLTQSGKSALRVNYGNHVNSGKISIPANTKVVFKGSCRKQDPNAAEPVPAAPKKSNVKPFKAPEG